MENSSHLTCGFISENLHFYNENYNHKFPGCCDVFFQSGTTGSTKGVMLSHDNVS